MLDFSTPSRRQKTLKADISCRGLLVTSAGIKIKGRRRVGRPQARRRKTPIAMVARTSGAPWPGWREIHTGIDGKSLQIRVVGFTVSDIDDGPRRRNRRSDPVRSGDRRRVAAVMRRVPVLPLIDRLLGRAEPLREDGRRLPAGLDRCPNLRRRRRLLVKMDQHARNPLRMSLRTDLAMKNAERRGSM